MGSVARPVLVSIPHQFEDDNVLHECAEKMRILRLRSLNSDSDAFSSSYETESQKPFEFWINRLLNKNARHILAVQPHFPVESDPGLSYLLEGDWLGVLVILGPMSVYEYSPSDDLLWELFPSGSSVQRPDLADSGPLEFRTLIYHLVGFYVVPEARKQGVGSDLVKSALGTMTKDCQDIGTSRGICMIGAESRNVAACNLYGKIGFKTFKDDLVDTDNGRRLTIKAMRYDLPLRDKGEGIWQELD